METNHARIYRRRWWTLMTLSLSLVIIGLDNTVLNVAIPTLRQEFDASALQLQWMIDAWRSLARPLLVGLGLPDQRANRAGGPGARSDLRPGESRSPYRPA